MRVVLFTSVFAPSVGGVETLVSTLALELSRQAESRIELRVVTSTPAAGMDDSTLPFIVERCTSLRQMISILRSADVIHLAGPSLVPMAVAWLLRKPLVLAHHGFQTVCPNGQLFLEPLRLPCPGYFAAGRHEKCWECNRSRGLQRSIWMWLSTFVRRWLAQQAWANIVPTRAVGAALQLPRTCLIPHGVPETARATGNGRQDTISFLGRLVSTKGAHVLLQAASQLRTRGVAFHLQIIGDGPERNTLEQQAHTAGLNGCVAFRGKLADSELDAALAGSIVVLPSLGGEVFGLVAAQNLMAGRVVVASDLGPLAEVVGETGLTFPPGDATALADCLEKLLRNPQAFAGMARQAHQRAKNLFTLERMTRSHVELYLSHSSLRP